MTDAPIHELRNALVPLDYALKRGTATLDDCAQVVRRLLDFADELAREQRASSGAPDSDDPAKVAARIRESITALRTTFGNAPDPEREVAAAAALLLHELTGWLPTP